MQGDALGDEDFVEVCSRESQATRLERSFRDLRILKWVALNPSFPSVRQLNAPIIQGSRVLRIRWLDFQ
jgi:hypothetical protein